jgi:hypothetical protein
MVPLQRHIRRAIDLYLALLANPSGPQLIEKLTADITSPEQETTPKQQVVFT